LLGAPCCLLAYACVGDDPGAQPGPVDAGEETSATDSGMTDGGSDAAADAQGPTCFGRPFGSPTQLTLGGGANLTLAYGPRYLDATTVVLAGSTSDFTQLRLYRATITGSNLSAITVLSPPALSWSPAPASPGSNVLVYASGPLPRDLAYATALGADFDAAAPIAELNTGGDEGDPWLVGSPSRAIYFGRQPSAQAQVIMRAQVIQLAPPMFASPTAVAISGANVSANVGTPVVTASEDTLFFSTWAAGFIPSVREVRLSVAGATASPTGPVVSHDVELPGRYVSWSSDDGCRVLLGSDGTTSGLAVAVRTPQ
jgi:hypothetical protein